MKNMADKPYLEIQQQKETTKEQLIYGGGDTLREIQEKKKNEKRQIINEG